MPVHMQSISQRIDWLMELSQRHSEQFSSPEAMLARERYLARHPTHVIVLKCMDGRIHIPYATRTPLGIIAPFRNLGGIFNLGWPYLGEMLADSVHAAVSQGRRVLLLITYHYSRGAPSRGCAGFNCNKQAAIDHAYEIKAQVEAIFGQEHQTVYPVVCGFETDLDALVVHGNDEQLLDIADITHEQCDALDGHVASLFPDMPGQVRQDLLPLLRGNHAHVSALKGVARALDIEHREWVICVGRGFDFLHVPNIALIVGPYSPNLAEPIGTAAQIIRNNMAQGRLPDDGFLLLASTPYHEPGVDKARATLKSRFLSDFAAQTIIQQFPDLADKMIRRTAILNWQTRGLELLDQQVK